MILVVQAKEVAKKRCLDGNLKVWESILNREVFSVGIICG